MHPIVAARPSIGAGTYTCGADAVSSASTIHLLIQPRLEQIDVDSRYQGTTR